MLSKGDFQVTYFSLVLQLAFLRVTETVTCPDHTGSHCESQARTLTYRLPTLTGLETTVINLEQRADNDAFHFSSGRSQIREIDKIDKLG